jgi:hypothetical protein
MGAQAFAGESDRIAGWITGGDSQVVQTAAVSRIARMQGEAPPSPFRPEEAPMPDPAYPPPPPARAAQAPVMNGVAEANAPAYATTGGNVYGEYCDAGCGGYGCEQPECRWCRCGTLADAWTLPQLRALDCRHINIGGWISAGVYANAYGDESNGPLGFRNMATGSLDQAWIYAERKTDTSKSVFDWGFRTDYVFGLDGPDTQAFGDQGWDFGWNSSRDYGSAIPQAYAEVAWNDLSLKAGRFYTPIGYEVVGAPGRFFYSTSYQQYYAEPFTHTGVLGTYKATEKLSVSAGWVDGWDGSWENRNGASMLIGGTNWTPGERFSLAWYFTVGNFGDGRYSGNQGEVYMQSLVATLKLTERLTYVFQNDYGINYALATDNAHWYGINQYLLYQLNDCWAIGSRFEWFRDDDGARVLGDGFNRVIANPGDYYQATLGLNYKPHSNVTLRPEVRYDYFDGTIVNSRPFDRGNATSQWSGGFDMIFTF